MTVLSEASLASYTGDGTTKAFAVSFPFAAVDDIDVTLLLAGAGQVAKVQVQGVDYALTGTGAASGTVTMITAPPASSTLTISRTVAITQATHIITTGPFSPAAHETAYDKRTFVEQQLSRRIETLETCCVGATARLVAVELSRCRIAFWGNTAGSFKWALVSGITTGSTGIVWQVGDPVVDNLTGAVGTLRYMTPIVSGNSTFYVAGNPALFSGTIRNQATSGPTNANGSPNYPTVNNVMRLSGVATLPIVGQVISAGGATGTVATVGALSGGALDLTLSSVVGTFIIGTRLPQYE